jgi:hypothetical protein
MKTRRFPILPLVAFIALTAGSAHAETIVVENSGGFVVGGPVSNTRTQAFNAGADADYLIVSTGGDTRDILTVSYDGTPMTLIPATATGNRRLTGIWTLANPSASGDIVFTLSGDTGTGQDFALAAASISSSDGNPIAIGAADFATDGSSPPSLSLNVPEDDSFVFVGVAGNQGSASNVSSPLTQLSIGTISSMSADAGYQNGVAAGASPNYTFTSNSTNSFAISAASFHVVPDVTPDPKITSISIAGDSATVVMTGAAGTDYYCAGSPDLMDWTTEITPTDTPGSPFQTDAGGDLTFTVDISSLGSPYFLRVQDTDPDPST